LCPNRVNNAVNILPLFVISFVLCIKTVPQMSFVMITLIGSSRRMCLNRSAVRSGNILRVTSVVARERDFTDLPRAHVFLCFNFFVLTSSPRYLVFCAMRRNCVPRVRRGEEKKKKPRGGGWIWDVILVGGFVRISACCRCTSRWGKSSELCCPPSVAPSSRRRRVNSTRRPAFLLLLVVPTVL
jgi:hypothetical protein